MTGIDREDAELSDAKSPKIYVTRKGGMYVKAEELLRRKKVRARIRAMSRFSKFGKEGTSESPFPAMRETPNNSCNRSIRRYSSWVWGCFWSPP